MDGPTSQNVMPVDGEGLPGKAMQRSACLLHGLQTLHDFHARSTVAGSPINQKFGCSS